MKKLTFIQNTIILVTSNLITGSLGFIFSILLSKKIGAQGVGLYQVVMPIYNFFICLTCGGTTTALSKIVAEQNSKNNTRELYKSVTVTIAFFSFWTIFVSIFMVLFAPFISSTILKDVRTYPSILIVVPALLFVTIGSILKGYFYGLQNSVLPAFIDIGEKAVRVIVLVTLVNTLEEYGLKYQVMGAVASMTAGEIISTFFLYIFYKQSRFTTGKSAGKPDNAIQLIVNVLSISLPLCINGFLSTALGTYIAIMIPQRLQAAGYARETSLALFGKISGMSMNIVMFPSIVVGSIAIILVPAISEASARKNSTLVNSRIYTALRAASAIAALAAGLFFSMPGELGKLFYNRNDLENILYSLSFGVIFVYVESTLFGILNGLGKSLILLRNTIIMFAIDIVLLYTLLSIPEINIYGYSIDFTVSAVIGCIINGYEIWKYTSIKINIEEILIFPIAMAALEAAIIINVKPIITSVLPSHNISTIALIIIGILVYSIVYFTLRRFFKKKIK